MQKIWDMAKEKLTTEEIRNEMLLRTDNDGKTAWHIAACFGKQDVIRKYEFELKRNQPRRR
jgi:hypothetical protein